jgi:hypothetical protein
MKSTIDLFSVVLHEMGHALGLNELSTSETSDGDYDVDADFVYGNTMAINTYSSSNKDHIYASNALMNPYTYFSRRTLPSAADVFAMASAAGWTTIDLPRKDAWAGGDWNTARNWEGNRLPDSEDEVWVRHGGTTKLSGAGEAGKLVIDKASTVNTGAYALSVTDTAQVTGGSKLIVGSGGIFSAKYLTVINASTLQLAGGTVAGNADDSLLTISEASSMTGNGTLSLDVKNNGTLSHGGSVGTITVNGDFTQSSTGTLTVDIGGTSAGVNSDLLSISGQADLSGKLDIDLLSAYTPSVGDTITILTYGNYVGEFDTLSDWIIGDGLYFATDYKANALNLVTTHAIDGDVNYDGLANNTDLTIMATYYNKTGGTAGWETADFNGDGYVNWNDLVLLAANYTNGDGTIGIDPSLLLTSVPEPATLGLLILGSLAIHLKRK